MLCLFWKRFVLFCSTFERFEYSKSSKYTNLLWMLKNSLLRINLNINLFQLCKHNTYFSRVLLILLLILQIFFWGDATQEARVSANNTLNRYLLIIFQFDYLELLYNFNYHKSLSKWIELTGPLVFTYCDI